MARTTPDMRGGAATFTNPLDLFTRIGYHQVLAAEVQARGKHDLARYYRAWLTPS